MVYVVFWPCSCVSGMFPAMKGATVFLRSNVQRIVGGLYEFIFIHQQYDGVIYFSPVNYSNTQVCAIRNADS